MSPELNGRTRDTIPKFVFRRRAISELMPRKTPKGTSRESNVAGSRDRLCPIRYRSSRLVKSSTIANIVAMIGARNTTSTVSFSPRNAPTIAIKRDVAKTHAVRLRTR